VQAMVNLLELPSGISLFRDIIVAHHCLPDLPGLNFINDGAESQISSFLYSNSGETPVILNLEWNAAINSHANSTQILVAENHFNNELDFIDVEVPPAVSLAHELGHYLYDLIACKNIMDNENSCIKVISNAIAKSDTASKLHYKNKMSSMFRTNQTIDNQYAQYEHEDILKGIVHFPPTNVELTFINMWNGGEFTELVNILPSATILRNGGSRYSDTILIGEAYNNPGCAIHNNLRFTDPNGNNINDINVAGRHLDAESFVRLSHEDAEAFGEHLKLLYGTSMCHIPGIVNLIQNVTNTVSATIFAFVRGLIDQQEIITAAINDIFVGISHIAFNTVFNANAIGNSIRSVIIPILIENINRRAINIDPNAINNAILLSMVAINNFCIGMYSPAILNAINNEIHAVWHEFQGIVQRLLNKITVSNPAGVGRQPLSVANNNLPNF
jgi:hypothetical protein